MIHTEVNLRVDARARSSAGRVFGLLASVACVAMLAATPARAGLSPEEVLVVVNDSSPISQAIGDYYAMVRSIPAENVFHLPAGTSTAETISRTTYNSQIRDPLIEYLTVTAPHLETQILCIVTTKGVPLRINGTDNAALDSDLTLLLTGASTTGARPNRYIGKFIDFRTWRDVEDHTSDMSYLVARLTGYQTDVDPGTNVPMDILDLMDRSIAPAPMNGIFLLDKDSSKTGGYVIGNTWMDNAKTALEALGETVVIDNTTTFVSNQPDIVGYASWGSNDCCDAGPPYYGEVPAGSGNVYPGSFLTRAITTTYVSTSGRTFTDGNQNYGQSLIADLVAVGASGGGGHVYEPFLNAVPQPQYLLPAYARGFSAAEAYYQSIASLSWMNTIVVDPLMTIREFGPPSIFSVVPSSGDLGGGELVTISGLEYRDGMTVLFDGVPATDVTWIDLETLEVVTPAGSTFGAVDVTVSNVYGEDTAIAAFTYEVPPVDLILSTTAVGLGEPIDMTVTGPPDAGFGLLVDLASGETCTHGVCFSLGFSPKLTVLHDSLRGDDDPLGPTGSYSINLVIPNKPALVGRFVFAQGVVDTPGPGLEVTPLRIFFVDE